MVITHLLVEVLLLAGSLQLAKGAASLADGATAAAALSGATAQIAQLAAHLGQPVEQKRESRSCRIFIFFDFRLRNKEVSIESTHAYTHMSGRLAKAIWDGSKMFILSQMEERWHT